MPPSISRSISPSGDRWELLPTARQTCGAQVRKERLVEPWLHVGMNAGGTVEGAGAADPRLVVPACPPLLATRR